MTEDLLSKLVAARSDEEREWLVMQFSLDSLAPEVRESVWAAAIPHWFDANFLAALLDKPAAEALPLFEQLRALSFIEPFQERGYNVHERSRALLLRQLWQNDQPRYRQFAQRAANYCSDQDESDTGWRIERIYHLLIADPDQGVNEFIDIGWDWYNPPNFANAKVEAMALVVRELADADRLPLRALAWTLFWEGLLDSDYSRYLSAKSRLLQIQITPEEDIELAAEVGLRLGETHLSLSEYDQARLRYEAALPLYRQIGDLTGEANCIHGLGDTHFRLKEYDQSRVRFDAALALYQQTGNRHGEASYIAELGEANCIKSLGDIHLDLSEYDQARLRYEAALALYRQIGDRLGEANCIKSLGDIHLDLSEYDQARLRYEAALALFQQIGSRLGEANCIKSLGDIHRRLKECDQARRQYEAALPLYRQIGNRRGEANCLQGLGDIHRDLREYDQALADFNRAIELNHNHAWAITSRGLTYRLMGRYEEALADFNQVILVDANDTNANLGLIACYRKLGMMTEYQHQIGLARELMAKEDFYNRACFASICGDVDEAVALLRSALEKREVDIAWARSDPDFDWIRDDPRFGQLLDEMAAQQS